MDLLLKKLPEEPNKWSKSKRVGIVLLASSKIYFIYSFLN